MKAFSVLTDSSDGLTGDPTNGLFFFFSNGILTHANIWQIYIIP